MEEYCTMDQKDYVSFVLMLALCLAGSIFKLWDYILVHRSVKKERASASVLSGQIVIRADWRSWLSTGLLFLGVAVPIVAGTITAAFPLVFFILFALAALYYCLHSLFWSITLNETDFVCRTLSGQKNTYAYADVRRIVPIGRKKRRMDGLRIVMADGSVIVVDRTLYGLDTLERRVRAVVGDVYVPEDFITPMRPLR